MAVVRILYQFAQRTDVGHLIALVRHPLVCPRAVVPVALSCRNVDREDLSRVCNMIVVRMDGSSHHVNLIKTDLMFLQSLVLRMRFGLLLEMRIILKQSVEVVMAVLDREVVQVGIKR